MDIDDLLEMLGVSEDWSTDGFGLDSCLIHERCGTMIEQDCPACPECGTANPMVAAGMI